MSPRKPREEQSEGGVLELGVGAHDHQAIPTVVEPKRLSSEAESDSAILADTAAVLLDLASPETLPPDAVKHSWWTKHRRFREAVQHAIQAESRAKFKIALRPRQSSAITPFQVIALQLSSFATELCTDKCPLIQVGSVWWCALPALLPREGRRMPDERDSSQPPVCGERSPTQLKMLVSALADAIGTAREQGAGRPSPVEPPLAGLHKRSPQAAAPAPPCALSAPPTLELRRERETNCSTLPLKKRIISPQVSPSSLQVPHAQSPLECTHVYDEVPKAVMAASPPRAIRLRPIAPDKLVERLRATTDEGLHVDLEYAPCLSLRCRHSVGCYLIGGHAGPCVFDTAAPPSSSPPPSIPPSPAPNDEPRSDDDGDGVEALPRVRAPRALVPRSPIRSGRVHAPSPTALRSEGSPCGPHAKDVAKDDVVMQIKGSEQDGSLDTRQEAPAAPANAACETDVAAPEALQAPALEEGTSGAVQPAQHDAHVEPSKQKTPSSQHGIVPHAVMKFDGHHVS